LEPGLKKEIGAWFFLMLAQCCHPAIDDKLLATIVDEKLPATLGDEKLPATLRDEKLPGILGDEKLYLPP
jgi:hypothetical protein